MIALKTMTSWCLLFAVSACGGGTVSAPGDKSGIQLPVHSSDSGAKKDVPAFSCDRAGINGAAELLAAGGECAKWIDAEFGRVAKVGGASGSIWSRHNPLGIGILVGAVHTRGPGFFGPAGTDVPLFLGYPKADLGSVSFVQLMQDAAPVPNPFSSGVFVLFHPAIPAAESGGHLGDILPRHDFFLAAVDTQRLNSAFGQMMGPLVEEPLPLRDPAALTVTAPTFASPTEQEQVLMLGFPKDGPTANELSASVGRVLAASEVPAVMAELQRLNDSEGSIPYEEEVELFIEGLSRPGMSGGPVFDSSGRQVGVVVRGTSAAIDGRFFVRAVRMDFIAAELQAASAALTAEQREKVLPFLEEP